MQNLKQFLKTTDRYVNILSENGIKTPRDFFFNFPRTYEDRTEIKTIQDLQEWVKAVVKVKIVEKTFTQTKTWKKLIEFKLEDEKQNIAYANFMNMAHLLRNVKKWDYVLLSWKAKWSYGKWVFWFPEILWSAGDFEQWNNNLVGKIVPIYSDMLWIKWAWFQKKMSENISKIDELFEEYLPSYLIKKYKLLDIKQALKNIHFPQNLNLLKQAKYRFNFEQLFIWQLVSNFNFNLQKIQEPTTPDREIVKDFLKLLPFELTNAQKKAIKKIIDDIHSGKVMRRLLQWDVWSWKTIVATIVSYYMIKKFWKQIAFLAPTEVLAKQHIKNIAKFFLPLWLKLELLTGSTKAKEKDRIKQDLREWNVDLVVWTHAIIQDDVIFKNLWLIIVDEQHKFWVKQRVKLASQWNPHMLQMTATPIPRSLALSYFWEFENTIIDELPPWRQTIYTKVISESEYENLFPFLINKIQQGQQVYIVTPLIEESEKMEDVQSAFEEYEYITDNINKYITDNINEYITDNINKYITDNKNYDKLDKKIYNIIWLAMDVYNKYWFWLRESFYEKKIISLLKENNFKVESQLNITDTDNEIIWRVDILVDDEIILELKSMKSLFQASFKQIRTYLELWKYKKAILLNFWDVSGLKHFIFTKWKNTIVSDWKKNSLWHISVWLMHWRLKADEKEKVMKDFKEWKIQILVSTTVIEVWVDVPQATIMIIKNAERFGLSALHQLRWRVGRNDLKSYCFLVTKSKSWESYRRLKYMEKYADGFKLAEIDLQTRGAGTILGTAQSGEMDLPEEALKDIQLLENTRNEARYILENNLLDKYPKLKKLVSEKTNLTSLIW